MHFDDFTSRIPNISDPPQAMQTRPHPAPAHTPEQAADRHFPRCSMFNVERSMFDDHPPAVNPDAAIERPA
jgi:hypothetical protein